MRATKPAAALALCGAFAWSLACDDSVQPTPPKSENVAPETFIMVSGDSLLPQLYRLPLSWLGSDSDGRVVRYRWRWRCEPGVTDCLVDSTWAETEETSLLFRLPVPDGTARYIFEIAAVDDDDVADPTPSRQLYTVFNSAPTAHLVPGTLPTTSLPAITFFFSSTDPDTTKDDRDRDTQEWLSHYEAWLDGAETDVRVVPIQPGRATLRLEDFDGKFDRPRTLFMRVVDDGAAESPIVQHTWFVESVPSDGVLLVDDCRMGNFALTSDRSYRNVVEPALGDRLRVLDIEAQPFLLAEDLSAQIALFSRLIWYTDADTRSSGALELARDGLLELLEARAGRMLLTSSLAFGTLGAFGPDQDRFKRLFGIDTLYTAPDGSTNFQLARTDSLEARVQPELRRFRLLGVPQADIVECFGSRDAADTRSLYFFPESTYVREVTMGEDKVVFANAAQFDVGVFHEAQGGSRTVYVSIPIGLPINTNSGENETEIRELLRLVGILDP